MSTATTDNGKSILESNLGQLLGFDDGVSDILDHLLSIESREDLLEYLLQLLGDSTPELIDFVDNIGKHKNGESIAAESNSRTVEDSKKLPPPASKNQQQSPEDYDTALMNGRQGSSPKRNKKKSKSPPRRKNNIQRQQQQSIKQKQKESTASSSSASSSSLNQAQNNESKLITTSKERRDITNEDDNPPVVVKKSHPPKGEPKINCGCFGMKHKPLTNCLFCGRISCIKEGYDFCPFCGYLIEETIKDPNHTYDDKAWIQKERLLRFDREFARRTEIFDDQADFQGPKTWMNEDEIAEAEEAEIRNLEKLKHPKQTLQLDI